MSSTSAAIASLVFTAEELTLLTDVAELTPLFTWVVSDLDEVGWDAVFRGLCARGVLVPVAGPEGGVSIAEDFRGVLGVAFLAPRATTVATELAAAGGTRRTVLRFQDLALEHEELSRGIHAFTPDLPEAAVDGLVSVVVGFPAIAETALAEPVTLSIDAYVAAIQQLSAGDLAGAQLAWPEGSDYLAHLAGDPESVSFSDVERTANDVRARTLSFTLGTDALWLVTIGESIVSVRPVDSVTAESLVRDLVA